jgi:glycine dehydrogenase subunit 1
MALAATVYLSLLGKEGIRQLANLCLQKAHYAAGKIARLPGFDVAFDAPFFNEFTIRTPVPADEVNRFLLTRDIIGGLDCSRINPSLDHHLVLAFTELNTRAQIDGLAQLEPEPQTVTSGSIAGGSAP